MCVSVCVCLWVCLSKISSLLGICLRMNEASYLLPSSSSNSMRIFFCFASSSCSALVPNLILVNFRLIVWALLLEFGFSECFGTAAARGSGAPRRRRSSVLSGDGSGLRNAFGHVCRRQFAAAAGGAAGGEE